jgi:hypothetical protein
MHDINGYSLSPKGKGKIHFENLYQVQTTHEIMHSCTKKTYATPLIR